MRKQFILSYETTHEYSVMGDVELLRESRTKIFASLSDVLDFIESSGPGLSVGYVDQVEIVKTYSSDTLRAAIELRKELER